MNALPEVPNMDGDMGGAPLRITGIVVIGVGILLVLLGAFFALDEYKQRRKLGSADFVRAVKELVVAIAESGKPSLAFFSFGTILIVIGGIISGVSGLQ
jgi:hypothetical protein